MFAVTGWLLVRNVADALDDHERRYEHVCADVAMLDEIPDSDGQAKKADAVCATHISAVFVALADLDTVKSMPAAGLVGHTASGGHPA